MERRRGAPESVDGGGEVAGIDCVDRHTFFVTPLKLLSRRRSPFAPTMSPAPPTATTNQDSCGGLAGQNLVVVKNLQQLLAPVERLRCTERLHERCSARQNVQGKRQECRWVALKSAILVLCHEAGYAPHVAAHAPGHPDELSPVVSPSAPLCPCELVRGTTIISTFSALLRCHRRRASQLTV